MCRVRTGSQSHLLASRSQLYSLCYIAGAYRIPFVGVVYFAGIAQEWNRKHIEVSLDYTYYNRHEKPCGASEALIRIDQMHSC